MVQPAVSADLHVFSEFHSKGVTLTDGGRVARRAKDVCAAVVCSATPLIPDEFYEISVVSLVGHLAGSLVVGVNNAIPAQLNNAIPIDCCYLIGKTSASF